MNPEKEEKEEKFSNHYRVHGFKKRMPEKMDPFYPDYSERQLIKDFPKEVEPDGTLYYGEKLEGLKHGRGKAIFPDESEYIGYWSAGKFDGRGNLINIDGTYFMGHFKSGEKHGFCFEEEDKSFAVYEKVNYEHGKKNGEGHMNRGYKEDYVGEFKNDLFHGKGKLAYSNGDSYEGDFVEGEKHGKGVFWVKSRYPQPGYTYNGDFVNNRMEGYGIIENHVTGKKYDGHFLNDRMHGEGKCFNQDGEMTLEGFFEHGKLIRKK